MRSLRSGSVCQLRDQRGQRSGTRFRSRRTRTTHWWRGRGPSNAGKFSRPSRTLGRSSLERRLNISAATTSISSANSASSLWPSSILPSAAPANAPATPDAEKTMGHGHFTVTGDACPTRFALAELLQSGLDDLGSLDHSFEPLFDCVQSPDRCLRNAVWTGRLQSCNRFVVRLAQPLKHGLLQARWAHHVFDSLNWQFGQPG